LLLLPVSFFFTPRSFTGYLIDLFPAALVALVTVEVATKPAGHLTWGRFRVGPLCVGALGVATSVTAVLALTLPTPLAVSLDSASIGSGQQHLKSITVTVTNRTGSTQFPHFLIDIGAGHPTGFWTTANNQPVVVGPHRSVTVTLLPATLTYFPPWASNWVIDAYTSSPRALSTTNDLWHNYIPKLNQP
jgi:hypothetical protein